MVNEIWDLLTTDSFTVRKKKLWFDDWMKYQIQKTIKDCNENIQKWAFRDMIGNVFDLCESLKLYIKVGVTKKVLDEARTTIVKLINPFTPHLCEEIWSIYGNKDLLVDVQWPTFNSKGINEQTDTWMSFINNLVFDYKNITKIIPFTPKKATFIVSEEWKNKVVRNVLDQIKDQTAERIDQ